MNGARCVADGVLYTSLDFSRLGTGELERLRRELVCPSCGARAFFRHRSRAGRAACFGSNDHVSGCRDAADRVGQPPQNPGTALSALQTIHVDLGGHPSSAASIDISEVAEHTGRTQEEGGGEVSRSLRTLLRHIVEEPAFLYSDTRIQAPGYPDLPARTFFMRFEQITDHHVDEDRGFWGTVVSYGYSKPQPRTSMTGKHNPTRDAHEVEKAPVREGVGDVWLNAGPPQEPSVLIPSSRVGEFVDHHHLASLEDIVGSRVLVLGRCARSSRGKVYVKAGSPRHLAFLH